MVVSLSHSRGTQRIYLQRGYRDKGILAGFNTRWGGWCVWVRLGGGL